MYRLIQAGTLDSAELEFRPLILNFVLGSSKPNLKKEKNDKLIIR